MVPAAAATSSPSSTDLSDDEALAAGAPSDSEADSIGRRLEESYRAANASSGQMSDSEKRVARRKERMEQVKERNDVPFFAGLLVAFLAPAAAILWAAFSSGYLDQLLQGQRY
jgi:hypothetical protein